MSVAMSSISGTLAFDNEYNHSGDMEIVAPRIFGREEEHWKLRNAFEQVAQTRQSQVVYVHGCSGVGKTAVVEELRDTLCESNQSFFCAGKYFQNDWIQEPYSAIMAAFSDLCDLVSQSDDFDEKRKLEIRRQFGPESHLLLKAISNLTPILGEIRDEGPAGDVGSNGAIAKFKIACKSFLHAMSCGSRPVVLFLDDIQWMDEGSKQLVELYLNDTELENVMFILAYRDEESDTVDSSLVNVTRENTVDITVGNFDVSGVATVVCGLLKLPEAAALDLCEVILQKTGGNPFYVVQFLDAICGEGLLVSNPDGTREFDVEQIQREIMVSDTLADLLLRKIQRLPQLEQETLKIASLLGYHFDEAMLQIVLNEGAEGAFRCHSNENDLTTQVSLSKATELGFVESIREGYLFSHDKIQSSFQSMLTKAEEEQLHLIIGEAFLQSDRDERFLHQALHLNKAARLIRDTDKRLRLVQVNMDAAKYCIERSAFDDAKSFLCEGLGILEQREKWTTTFALAFEMTELLAKMELVVGNLNSCKALTNETLYRARSVEMKIESLIVSVECHMAGNEMEASIDAAWQALKTLGIAMPRKVSMYHVLLKLLKVRRMLKGKTDKDILDLPQVQDPCYKAGARILINLAFYCTLQDEEMTSIFSALFTMELSLLHGRSSHSAAAFILYGCVEIGFGHCDLALRFGELGMKLLSLAQDQSTRCMTTSIWVSVLPHWKHPLQYSYDPIVRAVDSGFATGEAVYTSLAIANEVAIKYFRGINLQELEHSALERYSMLRDFSEKHMLLWCQPTLQLVLNLRSEDGDWNKLRFLTGEIMEEVCLLVCEGFPWGGIDDFISRPQFIFHVKEQYLKDAVEFNHPVLLIIARLCKLQLSYYFGFMSHAESIVHATRHKPIIFHYNFAAVHLYFFASLTCFERYRETGRRRHLKWARKWLKILVDIERKGSPNVAGLISLLRAESTSVLRVSKLDKIVDAFNLAISVMSSGNHIQQEALANERAGFVLAKLGQADDAKQYFERALSLYRYEWGATAKADWLEEVVNRYHSLREDDAVKPQMNDIEF